MSDVLHLQASDALLMQATFYATALKRERELREGQAQLLEQLRRQLKGHHELHDGLLDAAKQVLASLEGDSRVLALEVLRRVVSEVEGD